MQNPLENNNSKPDRRTLWICLAVCLLAVFMRAGFGIMQMSKMQEPTLLQYPDEQWYWHIGQQVHQGNGYVGEFGHRAGRMPFYPGFLSLFASFDNGVVYVRVSQWIIGSLAALFTFLLARRVGGVLAGTVAGLIVACDPGLVGMSNLLLTETFFVVLVSAWWWIGWPLIESTDTPRYRRWILAGLLAAATVYARPAGLALIPLWLLSVVFVRRFSRSSLTGSACVLLILIMALLPWAWRNHAVTGKWCWLTTRSGISLYDGVQPLATGAGDLAAIKQADPVRNLSEHEWNAWFQTQSRRMILEEPGRIIRLGFVKLARTWSPFLHADELQSAMIRYLFAAWSLLLYALILIGLIVTRRNVRLLLYLLVPSLMICCVHFFYVGSVRYRLGAIPSLAVLAGVGLAMPLVSLFSSRKRSIPESRSTEESDSAR